MQGIYYVSTLVKINDMNKKLAAVFSVLVILVFIAYMIIDSIMPEGFSENTTKTADNKEIADSWRVSRELTIKEGSLKAVAVSPSGTIFVGGDSFISCYDKDLRLSWNHKTETPVTSLSYYGDTLYASTISQILVFSPEGIIKNEWGPYEDNSIITSVASNASSVAFSDAGNKMIFILDKGGEVKKLIGQNDGQFIIPSPYFDIALSADNTLYIANTGHRRIETRDTEGKLKSYFGEPGLAPEAFCGCCNPAHFVVIPDGFVTAEKGLNRIKILNSKGEFVEFVSSKNKFAASIPLDLATSDGKTIFAANPADSKLYIFKRLQERDKI